MNVNISTRKAVNLARGLLAFTILYFVRRKAPCVHAVVTLHPSWLQYIELRETETFEVTTVGLQDTLSTGS